MKLLIQSANFAFEQYFQKALGMGEEIERAPPLPAITSYELEDSYEWEVFPPDETFFMRKNGATNPGDCLVSNPAFFDRLRSKAAKHSKAAHSCKKSAKKLKKTS